MQVQGGFMPHAAAPVPNYFTMQPQQGMPSGSNLANLPGSGPMDGMIDPNSATLNQLVCDQGQGTLGASNIMSIGPEDNVQQLLSNLSDGEIASNTSDLLRMLTESNELGDSTDLEKLLSSTEGLMAFDFANNGQSLPK
jgi:hypothetical protein